MSAVTVRNLARQRQLAEACALTRGSTGRSECALELHRKLRGELARLHAVWTNTDARYRYDLLNLPNR